MSDQPLDSIEDERFATDQPGGGGGGSGPAPGAGTGGEAATVSTPAQEGVVKVAVLGAGIAGLTAAHELAERGFLVTVYESTEDERPAKLFADRRVIPVKLGGMAASQWAQVDVDRHNVEGKPIARPFPGTPPSTRRPEWLPGEHGFRFFPGYYLHIWDTMQRTPLYEPQTNTMGGVDYVPTHQTVYDNIERITTQAMTTGPGTPNLIFSRDAPKSFAEFLTTLQQVGSLGFESEDLRKFGSRLARYFAMGPERRRREMERMSAYDFFIDRDPTTGQPRLKYSEAFHRQLRDMPKVLAAFDSMFGDARTNIDTYLQLLLRPDLPGDKIDAVLNGPTSEAWFDHWYRHLVDMGVTFVRAKLEPLGLNDEGEIEATVTMPDQSTSSVEADYYVVATDAPAAEKVTARLRGRVGGTVVGLTGFATSKPTEDPPRRLPQQPTTAPHADGVDERDPTLIHSVGVKPWDRFQTLSGIQYYFDTEFQLVRGHVYFTGSEWGLSSINQSGTWHDQPYPGRIEESSRSKYLTGYSGVLSVDIGDWNKPAPPPLDKPARECTDDEIAVEVWRQMVVALANAETVAPEAIFPRPVWYTLDRNIVTAGDGTVERNLTPYLVPIVNDWGRRPGGPPWNPHGTSISYAPSPALQQRAQTELYWEAAHGGYQVHCDSLVFAGTWTKTFTRMTSMEAANESARHAVNAIIDHLIVQQVATDRAVTGLRWRIPYGFLDQGGSSPVRQPTPVGDYCFIYDIENREPAEFRPTRVLDDDLARKGLPHPWESLGIDALNRAGSVSAPLAPRIPSLDELTSSLQQVRHYFETLLGAAGHDESGHDESGHDESGDGGASTGDGLRAGGEQDPAVVHQDDGLEGRIEVLPDPGGSFWPGPSDVGSSGFMQDFHLDIDRHRPRHHP